MTPTVLRCLSWAALVMLLVGALWVAQAELLRWHQTERQDVIALQRDLLLAERNAEKLPELRATHEGLGDVSEKRLLFWPGASPSAALLDFQEFAAATVETAGLTIIAVEARRSDGDQPAFLSVTLRASGTIGAFQQALIALERHEPKIAVPITRIERGREATGDPVLDVRLHLSALHQSAEKAQPVLD